MDFCVIIVPAYVNRDSCLVDRNSEVAFLYCILDKFFMTIIFEKYLVLLCCVGCLSFKLGDSDYLHCFAVCFYELHMNQIKMD